MKSNWTADTSTPSFESVTLPLPPEGDGDLVATVLRQKGGPASRNAVLYVHGYVDYFFHQHVADAVKATGWDFYAVELRRHGRSLRAGNRPNCCTDLAQYFMEITAAIDIVKQDGHDSIVLYGHSTGALLATLYGDSGERRSLLSGIVLNSPFLELKIGRWQRMKLPLAVAIGRVFPYLSDPNGVTPMYGESIHQSKRGEWNYDLRWKPINGFPAYFGWVRAIQAAQRRARAGLSVACPVLAMHSDASGGGSVWNDSFKTRDIVLNVDDIRAHAAGLGRNVTRVEIPGAVHDLMLSRRDVREHALGVMTEWMQRLNTVAAVSA